MISWETDPDKIAYEQLEVWLQKALAEQQFAYAVRVLFLMVLKDFSQREIIIWKRNKTNRDYLFEIRERELARSFRQMAHAFDASQRLRDDKVTEPNQRELLLALAPSSAEGLFLVPKVIE